MLRLRRALVLLTLIPMLAAADGSAQTEVRAFYGYAYDLQSGRYLYTEVHRQRIEGDQWVGGTISYYAPDGSSLGIKRLDFSGDTFVPVYRMALQRPMYVEAITDNGSMIQMQRRVGAGGKLEQKPLEQGADMTADSGFHSYLLAHFGDLMRGETVHFRMVVAGSLDAFKFRARRIDDTRFEGRDAVRFKVELDSLFRLLIDPLELTYDPQTRDLLEYRGISNLRDPATGEAYVARIAYYSKPPKEVAQLPPLELECETSSAVC
ncbi:hypothetical protein E4T66_03015 [Sinimarinibacterium sp. CAU 1509]|uniref:hypothetical protein n=1 Tax=Sinimarinibacterium sp. CAU 1509 TaxID=2562283 RepID=UPI0010ACFB08|nr:hypothetical protein [Sinimarinibacterium sp. CAU 1509]TJY65208.1 hypothetical protein E4T66_03015 [Sinimarinibacterium sp. CAU 1509]